MGAPNINFPILRPQQTSITTTMYDGFMTAGRVATDTDGLRWSSRLIQRVVDIVALIFGSVSKALYNFGLHAGGLASIVELAEPIKRGWQLAKAADRQVTPKLEIISLALACLYRVIGAIKYMHDLGVPGLAGFAATIGSIPAMSLIGFVGNSFDMASNSVAVHNNHIEREAAQAALALARLKLQFRRDWAQNGMSTISQQQYTGAVTLMNARRVSLVEQVGDRDRRVVAIDQLASVTWHQFSTNANRIFNPGGMNVHEQADLAFINGKIVHDVKRWQKECANADINKNKSIIAIIAAATKLAIITVACTGTFFGIAALAFTGPICVSIATLVAIAALVKTIYNRKNEESMMATKNFELPVLNPINPNVIDRNVTAAVRIAV